MFRAGVTLGIRARCSRWSRSGWAPGPPFPAVCDRAARYAPPGAEGERCPPGGNGIASPGKDDAPTPSEVNVESGEDDSPPNDDGAPSEEDVAPGEDDGAPPAGGASGGTPAAA